MHGERVFLDPSPLHNTIKACYLTIYKEQEAYSIQRVSQAPTRQCLCRQLTKKNLGHRNGVRGNVRQMDCQQNLQSQLQ